MARIRALFLDLDSTLLDGRTFHRSIERTCKNGFQMSRVNHSKMNPHKSW